MAIPIETGPMAAPQQEAYCSRVIHHLGLVSGMIDELGLVERIDALIPKKEQQIVSYGQAVKAMILNGLGFTQRVLYLTPHFFRDKPVEHLIGEGITAAQLNDDLLGRTLDAIHAYGCNSFYSQLAVHSVQKLGLLCQTGHLDSTSFHADGVYNSQLPPEEDSQLIHITQGYSRDHRPDLNQVVLQLLVERQAGIPLLMEALSGNQADKTGFRQTLEQPMAQLRQDVGLRAIVADSALYTAESLAQMNGYTWITRVPETLTLAKETIALTAPLFAAQPDEQQHIELCTTYADTRQRWLLIYSPAARQRALKTVNSAFAKQSQQELKAFEALCRQEFACQADAETAVQRFKKQLKLTTLADYQLIHEARYRRRGRPKPDQAADYTIVRIEGAIASNVSVYRERLQRKSCFILATNETDASRLPAEELLSTYKDQQKVERGFRFLKDPQFLASTLFLKSVSRLMSLAAIMTLCLLVYAALEYRIRTTLAEADETFPNQSGRPIANPTARWVFQYFMGIHILTIHGTQTVLLNMNGPHRKLLKLLGDCYVKYYSDSG